MILTHQTIPMQVNEIEAKTGKSLAELAEVVKRTGLTDPSKIRWMLQREYRIAYDEAKTLVQAMFERTGQTL